MNELNEILDHLSAMYEAKRTEKITEERIGYQQAILDIKWYLLLEHAKLQTNETTN